MTDPDLQSLRIDAAAGRPVSLTALSRAIRAERSQALSDLAAIARRQGAIDADDTDNDYDPWG